MIGFIKNLILDLFYGKKLKVSAQRIKKYKVIEDAFKIFMSDPSMPAVIVTGGGYDKIIKELPPYFRYTQTDINDTRNLVLPAVVYQFYLSGGTWKEIEEYNTVSKHGMLYGAKRRL